MSTNVANQNQSPKHAFWTSGRLALICLTMLILTLPSGCSSLRCCRLGDALVVSYRDMVWAKRAFNLRYGNCDRPYAQHFENGFCAGYSDVCGGGDGHTPALPPDDYRGYEFQTADGAKCINGWFEGYPAGVAAAKKDQAGTYHDVLISRMIDSAIKHESQMPKLPANIPVVQASQASGTTPVQSMPPAPTAFNYGAPKLPPIVTSSATTSGQPPIVRADYKPLAGANSPMAMGPSTLKDTDVRR